MAGRWEWVVDGAIRVGVTTSRRERTTSTVVVSGAQALLVDSAWEPAELSWIADDLAAAGITVTAGFATHAHHDHLLWHPNLGTAPRWASTATVHQAIANGDELVQALGPHWPDELADLVGDLAAVESDQLPWDGTKIELITHDAHAPGHTALWIPAASTLIGGDMLSDVELPLLEESTVAEYVSGLSALRPYVDRAQVVIPGHGTPAFGSGEARFRWTADHRYLDALVAGVDPADSRLELTGMREANEHNQSRTGR